MNTIQLTRLLFEKLSERCSVQEPCVSCYNAALDLAEKIYIPIYDAGYNEGRYDEAKEAQGDDR